MGGGIDNGGVLTVVDTRITENTAGSAPSLPSLASAVFAGGINNRFTGTLVLQHSVVSGNHAIATAPNGQNADTGGINSLGVLTIDESLVSDNTTEVTAALSTDQDWVDAETGGIHIGTCCGGLPSSATIRNTVVRGNRVTARNTDPAGVSNSFAGGIDVEGQLLLERSRAVSNLGERMRAGREYLTGRGGETDPKYVRTPASAWCGGHGNSSYARLVSTVPFDAQSAGREVGSAVAFWWEGDTRSGKSASSRNSSRSQIPMVLPFRAMRLALLTARKG